MHRDKYPQLRECSTKGPSIAHFTNSPDNDFFLKNCFRISERLSTSKSFNVFLERRIDDSPFGDDAGDVLVWRDIKSRVVDLHARRSNLHSLDMGDFGCFPLLDEDG